MCVAEISLWKIPLWGFSHSGSLQKLAKVILINESLQLVHI